MGIFNKVFVPTLASVLRCATFLPLVSSAEQLTESEENQIQTEKIEYFPKDQTLMIDGVNGCTP
ncbi:hypothetical protein [Paenibacillus kribbensis]|uniref:hypothetical protein n=1 Tax=Paenibacillus kribbensis TaxID=172713 RepID=UPI0008387EFE|nr:hypothetical protein [Paenibacillus kribbensis]